MHIVGWHKSSLWASWILETDNIERMARFPWQQQNRTQSSTLTTGPLFFLPYMHAADHSLCPPSQLAGRPDRGNHVVSERDVMFRSTGGDLLPAIRLWRHNGFELVSLLPRGSVGLIDLRVIRWRISPCLNLPAAAVGCRPLNETTRGADRTPGQRACHPSK